MKIELTREEILFLHNDMVHKMSADDSDLPECTWTEKCFTCNLYEKLYEAYVDVRDKP